jgi:hypothetical protein
MPCAARADERPGRRPQIYWAYAVGPHFQAALAARSSWRRPRSRILGREANQSATAQECLVVPESRGRCPPPERRVKDVEGSAC